MRQTLEKDTLCVCDDRLDSGCIVVCCLIFVINVINTLYTCVIASISACVTNSSLPNRRLELKS